MSTLIYDNELDQFFLWLQKEKEYIKCPARDPYELCCFKRRVQGGLKLPFYKNRSIGVDGAYEMQGRIALLIKEWREWKQDNPEINFISFIVDMHPNEKRYVRIDTASMVVLSSNTLDSISLRKSKLSKVRKG